MYTFLELQLTVKSEYNTQSPITCTYALWTVEEHNENHERVTYRNFNYTELYWKIYKLDRTKLREKALVYLCTKS